MDITIVVAAGNEGKSHTLDQLVPQKFGDDERFDMITVGGVNKEGKYYADTVNSRGQGGLVNLYAGAVDVVGARHDDTDESTVTGTGTSLAAPAVVSFIHSISVSVSEKADYD
jgi:subtilisin family serine protease